MSPKPSRSGPFLVEMTLVILFFAISASVCVSLFAAGYRQSEKSKALGGAVLVAQSAAECMRAGDEAALAAAFPALSRTGDGYTCALNEAWQSTDDGLYTLHIQTEEEGGLLRSSILVTTREGEELCRLRTACIQEVEP